MKITQISPRKWLAFASLILLTGCGCKTSLQLLPIQNSDKGLSCKDIELEINESEFYKRAALKDRNTYVGNIIAPFCHAATAESADDAVRKAEDRVQYLQRIYYLRGCQRKKAPPRRMAPPPNFTPVPPPNMRRPVPPPGARRAPPPGYRPPPPGYRPPPGYIPPPPPKAEVVPPK